MKYIKNNSKKVIGLILLVIMIGVAVLIWIQVYEQNIFYTKTLPSFAEKLRSENIKITNEPPEFIEEIKLLFVGDTMLARTVGEKIEQGEDPFVYVRDIFSEYDYVIANLECVISDKGIPISGKQYTFRGPVEAIQIMKDAGIDIVSLANNHVFDYGADAFVDMLKRLDEAEISYFGGGNNSDEAYAPLIISAGSKKVGLVGYNNREIFITAAKDKPGNAWFDETLVQNSLVEALNSADLVIPFVHWGEEFTTDLNSTQTIWAKFFIDNGASLVVGSHPHMIQTSEPYNNVEIVYSLGNFVFDQMYLDAAKGNMLEVIIEKGNIKSTKLIGVKLDTSGFPFPE